MHNDIQSQRKLPLIFLFHMLQLYWMLNAQGEIQTECAISVWLLISAVSIFFCFLHLLKLDK